MALNDEESSDWFMMNRYKIRMCRRGDWHLWRHCPYAHRDEKCRRRDHTQRYYSSQRCHHFLIDGACPDREECEFAHGNYEVCDIRFCCFAHNQEQDRRLQVRQQQHHRRRRRRQHQFSNQQRFTNQLQFLNQPRFAHNSVVRGSSSAVEPHLPSLPLPRMHHNSQTPMFWRGEEQPQQPLQSFQFGPSYFQTHWPPPVGTQTTTNIGVQFLNAQNGVAANFPSAVYNQPPHQPQSSLEEARRSKRKIYYEAGSSNS